MVKEWSSQIKGWLSNRVFQASKTCAIFVQQNMQAGPRSRARSTARSRALLRSLRGLRRIRTNTQSRKKIKDLSLSSNRRHIKYGVKFSSGFLMAWPKLG